MINANELPRICDTIRHQSFPQISWNDKECNSELEHCFHEVSKAFDVLLPNKSSFEK